MDKQYGYLVGCDNSQFLHKISEASCSLFLNDIYVQDTYAFDKVVHDSFTTGLSGNRSNIFYMYYYRKNSQKVKGIDYHVGVFGLKDKADIQRKATYANYYLCSIDELRGKNFFHHVFGTDYIEESEFREATDPEKLFDRKYKSIDWNIDPKDKNTVMHIMEKLWTVQEENLESRFVILMDNAEKNSMELLRQIYLLIPAALRLSMGFATNVTTEDIENLIVNNQGLPIHIFTMEGSAWKNRDFSFPVVCFDVAKQKEYCYDPKKIEILNTVCGLTGPVYDTCYKYSEKSVLENAEMGKKVPSFKHLRDITESLLSGDLFWWKKESVNTVSQIYRAYYGQKGLMQEEEIHKDVLYSFFVKKTEQGTLAKEIMQMLENPENLENRKYLDFLKQEFQCAEKLTVIEDTLKSIKEKHTAETLQIRSEARIHEENALQTEKEKHAAETEEIRSEARTHEEQALNALKKELEDQIAQYIASLEKQEKEFQEKENSYKLQVETAQEEKERFQQEAAQLRKDCEADKKQLDRLAKDKAEYQNIKRRYRIASDENEENRRKIEELNMKIRQLNMDSPKNMKSQLERCRKEIKMRTVLMIVFLIAGFVGGGLCGYLFHGGNPDGEYEEKVTITPTPEAILTTAPKGTETPEATPTSTPTPKTTEKTESSEALTAAPAKQKNAVDVDKIIENII
ncbi:MAG: hypothetical protein KH296_15885 [Ruminococcus sp.]|nr:hypothetical protein [Ruminococcus sp.]